MFVKVHELIIKSSDIEMIDCKDLERFCQVRVTLKNNHSYSLYNQEAIDLVMALCPSMMEGKRLRFHRHRWALHNLIAHPTLQLLAWVGLAKLGFRIHDSTVPRPIGIK